MRHFPSSCPPTCTILWSDLYPGSWQSFVLICRISLTTTREAWWGLACILLTKKWSHASSLLRVLSYLVAPYRPPCHIFVILNPASALTSSRPRLCFSELLLSVDAIVFFLLFNRSSLSSHVLSHRSLLIFLLFRPRLTGPSGGVGAWT